VEVELQATKVTTTPTWELVEIDKSERNKAMKKEETEERRTEDARERRKKVRRVETKKGLGQGAP